MATASAEVTLRNLLDHFVPNAKLLVIAGRNLIKNLQGVQVAFNQYSQLLNKLADDSKLSDDTKEIGFGMREMVNVYTDCEKSHSSLLSYLKQHIIDRIETDIDADPKLIMENLRAYQKGQKIYAKKAKDAQNNMSQIRKRHLTKAHNPAQLEEEFTILENEAKITKQQLTDYETKSHQLSVNEEKKRYSFILDHHCVLLKMYQDYQHKSVESLNVGLSRWTKLVSNTQSERIPQSFSNRSDLAASGVYEELEEMRSRATFDLSPDDLRRQHEETTNFTSTDQMANADKFIEDQFKTSLDESFAEALDAGYRSFVPPQPTRLATAVHYYNATGDHQLQLKMGDPVEILKDGQGGWQFGVNRNTNQKGWFPASRVEETPNQSVPVRAPDNDYAPELPERPHSFFNNNDNKLLRRSYLEDSANGYGRIMKNRRSLQEPPITSQRFTQPLPPVPEDSDWARKDSHVTFATSPTRSYDNWSPSEGSASPTGGKVVVALPPKLDLHHTNFDTVPSLRKVVTMEGVPKKLV